MTDLDTYLRALPGRCTTCGHHLKLQACACAGLAAKAHGQALTTAAHPSDRAAVEAAVRQLAATREPFSANSARAIHGVRGPVVGAVFSALASEGLIKRIGYVASTDPGTHAHPVAEWLGVAA